MGNSKSTRSSKGQPAQHTFLLPSPSVDSLPSANDLDDVPLAGPSRRPSAKPRSPDKTSDGTSRDGKSAKERRKSSAKSASSDVSVAESESETKSLSRQEASDTQGESKREKKKRKKDEEKARKAEIKGPKTPLGQVLRQTLSPKSIKGKDKGKLKDTKHGFSISSDPLNVYEDSTETAPNGRVRTSQHMTAEFKVHIWRNKYDGEGRLERLINVFRTKRARRLLHTIIDLQKASLASLRR
ncbi:hypothetical protein DRE_00078 [Drechslerella stenobrocha 248]|uniref:Uncharacterized protein n=1 Tax=Drechslerella stenobrocha 248 TaxID=1043628 RepID=W7I8Y5_9PEZI|nr:hypothetical protein DRE_00078 [Drechslerella stenobrocha 248]